MDQKWKTRVLTSPLVVCGVACFCCLLWGSAIPVIKKGYELWEIGGGDYASKILFAGCRFFLAGVLVVLIASLSSRRILFPARGAWPYVFKLSLVQTVMQYIFLYVGLANTAGVRTAILNGSSSFFAIVIACFFLRTEKFTLAKAFGCLLGPAGIVLMNLGGSSGSSSLLGDACVLLAALSYALSSSLLKVYSRYENPVVLSGWQFILGSLMMIAVSLGMGGRLDHVNPSGCVLFAYLAILSAVAYSFWGMLLKYNPVSSVTIYGFTTPIFGVILSGAILGEDAFSLKTAMALLLVSGGIFVVNYADFRRKSALTRDSD